MKKIITTRKLAWLAVFLVLLSAFNFSDVLDGKDEADLDPVAFSISSNKKQVKVGEEFEIKVVATKRPNWDSRLGHTAFDTEFRLKVVFPDGFEQTGGTYSDYVHDSFGSQKTTLAYTIKGKFTRAGASTAFTLLRGSKESVEVGRYVFRGQIKIVLVDDVISSNSKNLRTQASITCSGYTFTDGQVIGTTTSNAIIQIESGCAVAYWQGGGRVNIDWLPLLNGKTVPDNILQTCVKWEGQALDCSGCTSPSAPTITKTAGTTVCAANSQSVTLTASACTGGTVTWYKDGVQVGTGTSITRTDAGNYTATCTVGTCASAQSTPITVTETSGCGTGSQGCVPNKVRLIFRFPGECCMERLVGAKIQGSNNGTGWTDLYTFSQNGNGNWQEFTFPNTTSYTSLRFMASSTGWGEIAELEFYNGTTKLTGTTFGQGNYALAFDGQTNTKWEGTSAGTSNIIGLNLTGCGPVCTPPSAPTITKTAGTTVCAANSQSVTLTSSVCTGGTVTWYKDGVQVGTGTSITRTDAGNYTATCTVGTCASAQSTPITVTETSGCGTGSQGCIPNKVRLIFRFPGECCMERLVGAKIQGSNNGTSWTDLYTFSQNGNGNWQEFTFPNTTSYTSLRFMASSTGWGEIAELEFYNGTTKLTGTTFGQGNYALAFDGQTNTKWEGTSAGTSNIIGLNLTGCGPVCTPPSAPTITKTAGTTVCAANSQSVTLTSSVCTGGTVTWYKDGVQVGTGTSITRTDAGNYTATCTVGTCASAQSTPITVTQTTGCGSTTGPLGAYSTVIGGREFTYNKTPEFALQFNSDGTISDVTPGMTFDGTTNKVGTNRVYYQIGYKIFENFDGSYNRLQNLYLPDGIYVIRQFICNENAIPTLAQFKSGISGWNNGVTISNSRLSEIFLSIKTSGASSLSITPSWLKVNRNFIFPSVAQPKNLATIDKFFGLVYQNRGSQASEYHALGVNTDLDYGDPADQPNTWNTVKWPTPGASTMTNQALYDYGYGWIGRSGNSKRFILTDEIPENAQGEDPTIYSRMYHFYKGAYDRLVANAGVTDKKQTGLYGPYGGDNMTISTSHLKWASRSDFEKSLTTHVHRIQDPATGTWAGDADYYTSGQINVRNLNLAYYLKTDSHNIPYELVYANERIKIGTKTYQNQDREANWMTFTWHKVEPDNGLQDSNGNRIGIEFSSSGELIPFSNGTILSKDNLEIPALWDEYVNLAFWSTVIGKGIVLWNGPLGRFGNDATKLNWWRPGQPVYWTSTGGTQESYVSGQNGAPVKDASGLESRLWASPGDAAYAGMEAAWNIRDRIATLSHASYSSSRGTFTANPGSAGLHLNGFGVLNTGLFVVRDAWDAKKGLALVGTGTGGNVIIYYNGFLSQHEYEDNVTVNGQNLGRVYGRQTVVKTY